MNRTAVRRLAMLGATATVASAVVVGLDGINASAAGPPVTHSGVPLSDVGAHRASVVAEQAEAHYEKWVAEQRRLAAEAAAKKAAEDAAKAKAAADAAAKAAADRAAAAAAASRAATRSATPGSARAIGLEQVRERGWSDQQFACLDKLWTRESNWRASAHNGSSGAHGIPQAMPGSKMSSHGSDWHSNPATQIAWGLDYIDDRYGDACSAWSFWQSHHWY